MRASRAGSICGRPGSVCCSRSRATGLPVVRHWGADLGPLDGPELRPDSLTALAGGRGDAVRDHPGLRRGRRRRAWSAATTGSSTRPTFTDVQTRLVSRPELAPGLTEQGADTVVVTAECATSGLCLDVAIQLTAAGVVRCRAGLTNRAAERYRLDGLRLVLPAGEQRHPHRSSSMRQPLRSVPLRAGAFAVPDRRSARPGQVVVAEAGAGYRRGEVWQAHVAFSGAVTHSVEVAGGRTYLGGGERLVPGEVVLARGEAYHSPWVLWTWGDGLDAAAARLHAELRAAEPAPMPVVFDATAPAFAEHDRTAMLRLAEYAAAVGVETFLLDLDWCVRAGLDPYADHEVRGEPGTPDDLAGLLDRIRGFDLDVGLALDLERLDPASSIARDHPEWLLEVERDGTVELVLDLSIRSAVGYAVGAADQAAGPASGVPGGVVAGGRGAATGVGRAPARQHAGGLPAARRAAGALPRDGHRVHGAGRGDGPAGRWSPTASPTPAGGTRSSGRWCRCCRRSGCGSRRTTSPRMASRRGTGRWPRSSGRWAWGSTCVDRRRPACGRSTAG